MIAFLVVSGVLPARLDVGYTVFASGRLMPEPEDDALMREVSSAADPTVRDGAFREIVRRHGDALGRFLSSYTGGRGDIDDLVQEAFVRVYLARDRYTEGEAKFRTWLFRIGRNLALDGMRRGARRKVRSIDESVVETGVDPKSGPLAKLVKASEAERIRGAIEDLPEADREAVILRFHEDLAYEDIAEIVGSSAAAVKQRVFRAMRRLRDRLDTVSGGTEVRP